MAGIVVVGALRVANKSGVPMYDKRGRPLWRMPKPMKHVRHFACMAARRILLATGKIPQSGYRLVPVYRGEDLRVAKKRQYNVRRAKAGRWTN